MIVEMKLGYFFGLFLKIKADGNAMFLLVIAQQPGRKFH
jgi:hypothetical protein